MLNRRKFIKQIGLASAAATTLGTLPLESLAASRSVKLTILHTNDVHSRIEPFPMDGGRYQGLAGAARRYSLIQEIRAAEKNVLLVDAGDMFQGTPYFNLFGGKIELDIMSKLGYEAGTFGNHEFDNGLDGLIKYLDHANFPFLTANYDFKGTVLEGKTQDYMVINKGGVKVGLFGLGVQPEGLVDIKNYKGMTYLDPVEVTQKVVPILKNKLKCDLVICLSHLGYSYSDNRISDLTLAAQTKDIDLIIGGHTHTFLDQPTLVKNSEGKQVIVNQVGFAGINLGRIDMEFSKDKQEVKFLANTYRIDDSVKESVLA